METTQAVTDAATIPKKPSVNKGGRPSKAALEARARANRDPLASIEGDTSLDQPPDYKPDVTSRIPKPPFFRFGTDQPSPHKPEHFFAWWCGLSAGAKNGSIAYVYRNYPVIQIKTPDSKSPTGFRPSTQIDKRSGSDPLSSLDDVLQDSGVPGLRVLTSGPLPPNAAELLGSARMRELLVDLHTRADVVVIDSPPVTALSDAAVLATQADGVLLVVDTGRTTREMARRAVGALRQVNARVVGALLNRMPTRGGGYYYYYSHYDQYDGPAAGSNDRNRKRSRKTSGRPGKAEQPADATQAPLPLQPAAGDRLQI